MANPRVIFVNRVYWPNESATAQLLTDLAEGLAARGWETHVICAGATGGTSRHGVQLHRTGFADEHRGLAHRACGYLHFLAGARRHLRTLTRPGDIVVLKTDPPMLAAAATSLVVNRGAHVVQWIQDIYPEIALMHGGGWMRPLLAPLRRSRDRAWQRAAACVPVGEDMATVVVRHGVASGRVHVLPNWAPRELELPASTEAIAAHRQARGWQDKFVIVYSGNLGRVHEFRTLLDTARHLRDRSDFLFVFVGGGARLREVKLAVQREGLSNVQFAPPQPRSALAPSLAAAEVHAVTLLPGFETLVHPSKISGVLAAGRPVVFVGPPQSALARFLHTHACGACVAPGDSPALAAALRRWSAAHEERRTAGENARRAYESALRYPAILERWDALFRSIGGTALPINRPPG